jgi:hypothetical protein
MHACDTPICCLVDYAFKQMPSLAALPTPPSQVTIKEALEDRRLSLIVNMYGVITRVGNAAPHLFGFDPQQLVGLNITSLIDCLAPPSHTQDGFPLPGVDDSQEVAHMMAQLGKRATLQPGRCSHSGDD